MNDTELQRYLARSDEQRLEHELSICRWVMAQYRCKNAVLLESKPNPWLAEPTAEHFETDCSEHPQSECVITTLHTLGYGDLNERSVTALDQTLVAESACGRLAVWMD